MSRALDRALQAAGGVAVVGGLLLGGMSMPLADYGCPPAFGSADELNRPDLMIAPSCGEQRAERQETAITLLVLGLGLGVGAQVHLLVGGTRARPEERSAA
ncbi:hypothetical protein KUM42_19455 [Modestobacter sp. L9-4]|uniref:hypothetical protein n=1 Tax=Modestobacter sp. L9-4 TaxID=2851567 RepID=UPI001C78B57C|nr:hypothetical protein [Modestobacter sp. L9-4]QXG75912.1 hypothetical protein KUM42_19455 [Modestobacter sp. L9-4]